MAPTTDFGLARRMYDKCKTNEASVLPVGYMAPESIRRREYSIKSDSFSFGVFLWELVTKYIYSITFPQDTCFFLFLFLLKIVFALFSPFYKENQPVS